MFCMPERTQSALGMQFVQACSIEKLTSNYFLKTSGNVHDMKKIIQISKNWKMYCTLT